MSLFEHLTPKQKLRAALLRDVRSVCTETCHFLGLEIKNPAIDIITEVVYKKISTYGLDLEAFARHAKRSTINSDDVRLLVRRNPSLREHLGITNNNPSATKDKRRKTETTKQNTAKVNEAKTSTDIEVACQKTEAQCEGMEVNDTIDLTFD